MSLYTFAGQLPKHIYCYVDSTFITKDSTGYIPAVWFAITSYPSRMWGLTVHLESGAIYRSLPPHAIGFSTNPEPRWTPQDAETWDCYGYQFTTIEYSYLAGLGCIVKANDNLHKGQYLFTAAPINDGFSAAPEQAKEFKFIRLDNGRLTIQPTNHVAFEDLSFTGPLDKLPKGLERQSVVWTCE
jgi:hypothetical protein